MNKSYTPNNASDSNSSNSLSIEAPSQQVIYNILNYSKSLQVIHLGKLNKSIYLIKN